MSSLAIDLMGGDYAPQVIIEALQSAASDHPRVQFHAVGTETAVNALSVKFPNITTHTVDVAIRPDEPLSSALKHKTRSSMGYCISLVKTGMCDLMISAGNTAVLMSLGCLYLKTMPKVRRPAIMSNVAYQGHNTALIDLGANISATAEDLHVNAQLATDVYPDQKIALLNVGVEPHKGTEIIKQADALMRSDPDLNYIGFIEGDQILKGKADIVVCDGYVGNCITKLLESVVADLSEVVPKSHLPQMATAAQLMGINGQVFKAHGKSSYYDMLQALHLVVKHTQTLEIIN